MKSIRFSNYFGAEVNYDFTQRLQFKVNGKLVSENVVGIDNEIEEEHFETTARIQ